MLTGGLANTSFIGLPMIETFYGPQFLGLGILIDQLGSYFVLSTLGILVASLYSSGRSVDPQGGDPKNRDVRALSGVRAGVAADAVRIPDLARRSIQAPRRYARAHCARIGRLPASTQPRARQSDALATGLGFKLVLAPALILLLFAGVLRAKGQVLSVTVFEAAMGPMIGASIVAIDHELDPPLLTLMVGVGIPLSFLTLPVWWHLLNLL